MDCSPREFVMSKKAPDKWQKILASKMTAVLLTFTVAGSAIYTAVAANDEGEAQTSSVWKIPYADLGSNDLNYSYSMNIISGGSFAMDDKANAVLLEAAGKEATDAMKSVSEECSSETGLGGVQARDIADAQKQASVGVDLNKIYQYGEDGGCFNALMDFPDLSASIPSFTDVMNNVKNALIKYATRKVCSMVNDTLEEAVSPIRDKLDVISDRGQLDLNGQVNKEITKKMYEVDTDLGKVSTTTKPDQTIELKW